MALSPQRNEHATFQALNHAHGTRVDQKEPGQAKVE